MTTDDARVVELNLRPRALWTGLSALTLLDLFPNVSAAVQREPSLIVVAGFEDRWSTTLELRDGLWTLEFKNSNCSVWSHERWLRLTNRVTLEYIRAGNILPQHLELVLTPRGPESRHTAPLEYWTFGPDEWELVGWKYHSEKRIGRMLAQLSKMGADVTPNPPSISFRLRLLPKPMDLSRMRLLAYCGTAYPLLGRRR